MQNPQSLDQGVTQQILLFNDDVTSEIRSMQSPIYLIQFVDKVRRFVEILLKMRIEEAAAAALPQTDKGSKTVQLDNDRTPSITSAPSEAAVPTVQTRKQSNT